MMAKNKQTKVLISILKTWELNAYFFKNRTEKCKSKSNNAILQ